MRLNETELADLCRGAAFLGTGGGGDPYVGRLIVREAMRDGRELNIIPPESLPDDALVIPTAMMGAPTVLVEKLPAGDEAIRSLRALEKRLGKRAYATMPIEVGGINSTIPLAVGARLGLPVVDADGMGRAFPELQMETFAVYGISGTPMAVTNEYGDTALIETRDNRTMEWIARGVAIRMGGCAYIAEYAMTGADVKRTAVPNTLSLALKIGRAIREAREQHRDPFEALLSMLPTTPYSFGRLIFAGKVSDVRRETRQGFAVGGAQIDSVNGSGCSMELTFQNEHLIARSNGRVLAIVPDLICVLDADTAEPITTEALRYGQRVRIMAVAVPPIMRTAEALAVFGPRAFGLAEPFQPIETLT